MEAKRIFEGFSLPMPEGLESTDNPVDHALWQALRDAITHSGGLTIAMQRIALAVSVAIATLPSKSVAPHAYRALFDEFARHLRALEIPLALTAPASPEPPYPAAVDPEVASNDRLRAGLRFVIGTSKTPARAAARIAQAIAFQFGDLYASEAVPMVHHALMRELRVFADAAGVRLQLHPTAEEAQTWTAAQLLDFALGAYLANEEPRTIADRIAPLVTRYFGVEAVDHIASVLKMHADRLR